MHELFRKLAHKVSIMIGTSWAFAMAVLLVLVWAVSGPIFNYSDTWQLTINTGTTIMTFLIVFLIQNTQNRDARAMHLKLDELIYSIKKARNQMLDIEDLSDEEMEAIGKEFKDIHERAEKNN